MVEWKNGDVVVDYGVPTVAQATFGRPATGPYADMLNTLITGSTKMKNATITAKNLQRLIEMRDVRDEACFTTMMNAFHQCKYAVSHHAFFSNWITIFEKDTNEMVKFFEMYEAHKERDGICTLANESIRNMCLLHRFGHD